MHVNPMSFVLRLRHFGDKNLCHLKVTSREKMEYIFDNQWEAMFFFVPFQQFVILLVLRHNDVEETGLKRALNLIWARIVIPAATYNI